MMEPRLPRRGRRTRDQPWHPFKLIDTGAIPRNPIRPETLRLVAATTAAIYRAMGKIK